VSFYEWHATALQYQEGSHPGLISIKGIIEFKEPIRWHWDELKVLAELEARQAVERHYFDPSSVQVIAIDLLYQYEESCPLWRHDERGD
jgi:hypothetical protein